MVLAMRRFFYKRLRKHQLMLRDADAPPMAIFNLDAVSAHIISNGYFDLEHLEALKSELVAHNLNLKTKYFIDIGANIGNHSIYLADCFETVIAFEPHPRTFKLLEANALLKSNIRCKNLALGAEQTKLSISTDLLNMGKNKLANEIGGGNNEVDVVKLDDCLEPIGRSIGLIKIDVEGHEAAVLKGGSQLLNTYHPPVVIEILRDEIKNGSSESLEILRSLGYNQFKIFSDELQKKSILGRLKSNFSFSERTDDGFKPINTALPHVEIPMLLAMKQ